MNNDIQLTDEFLEYLSPRYNRNRFPAFCAELGGRMNKVCRRAADKGLLRLVRSGGLKTSAKSFYYEMYRLTINADVFHDQIEAYNAKKRNEARGEV